VGLVDLQVQAEGLVGGVVVGALAPGAGPVLEGVFKHVLPRPGGGGVAQLNPRSLKSSFDIRWV